MLRRERVEGGPEGERVEEGERAPHLRGRGWPGWLGLLAGRLPGPPVGLRFCCRPCHAVPAHVPGVRPRHGLLLRAVPA